MGFLRQMKDAKQMMDAAPGMVAQARQMAAQAQEMAAAQQAALGAQAAQAQQVATGNADFSPIAGVSIELYAEISKGLAAYAYDITKAPEVAASKGVSAEDWAAAQTGWNDRIKADKAVAQRFNALYMGRA
jgi:hypothetical protein